MKPDSLTTEVLIVGGGPAGASAALSLCTHTEHTVVLVEQSDMEQVRVGEHVSSSIFDLLTYLKIDSADFNPGSFIPAHESTSYWGSNHAVSTHSIFTTEEATFQLDREKFDLTLLEKVAERGGIVFPRTKCTDFIQDENNFWHIRLKHPEKGIFNIKARYLVDATGRKAHVCRHLDIPSQKTDNLMGVGVFLEGTATNNTPEQLLETTELGWWYTAQLPENRRVATFFSDADIISDYDLHKSNQWNELLQSTKHLKYKLEGTRSLTSKPWVRNASTQLYDTTRTNHFIAIGDAISSFDPISSMGIGFAITTACHAVRHIQAQLTETATLSTTTYQKDIQSHFEKYMEIRQQFYQKEKRWSTSPFWKRRQGICV